MRRPVVLPRGDVDAGAGPCAVCGRPGHNARFCNANGRFKLGDGVIYNRRSVLLGIRRGANAKKRAAIQRKWAKQAENRERK